MTELFELAVRYVVPLYQRPYVWDKDDQWEPLWEDIRALLEHQEGGAAAVGGWSHFLGAIVLDQETQAPGTIPVYVVIDGQQRLTTLQVLLAAAAKVASNVAVGTDAALMRELITNNPLRASGDEVFKVWPTNVNRKAFKAVMQDGGPSPDNSDDPNNKIEEAYAYFASVLQEWVTEDPDEATHVARLSLLRVTLCALLRVVTITLEAGDNAQVIFETLNARGTPLLALDLVKNVAFLEASRQGLDVDALYEEQWRPQLDDDYWRVEVRQGRLNRPRAELFLMHWLGMKLRRVIPATELFTTFRLDILQGAPRPKADDLVHELCRDASILRGFDDQAPGSPEALFFERLQVLDTTTVMPLVLYLFCEPTITPERRRRALAMIESWLVRRALMRLTGKNYNQQIGSMLEKMGHDPARADEIILDHLRSAAGEATRWPTDEQLLSYLTTRDAYYNIAQPRIAMVFAAIERSLYNNKVEALSIPPRLSIEHVMPQTRDHRWPLPEHGSPEERAQLEAERNLRIHRWGNLTVTTLPLNSALSNSAWPKKRTELNKGSKLLLNQLLIDEHPDGFDDQAIDQRTLALAERICSIWPGRESPAWPQAPQVEAVAEADPTAVS